MRFSEMTLSQLERAQQTYYEIVKQIGKLVIQDLNAALVLIPNAIQAEINIKKEQKEGK